MGRYQFFYNRYHIDIFKLKYRQYVWECCKDDQQSQMEILNFDPAIGRKQPLKGLKEVPGHEN